MSLFAQPLLDLHDKLIVDLFAGGGGSSSGIEEGLGRMVDIAINHDEDAVSMHAVNHPQTKHLVSDVFEVDPRKVTEGRPVGLLWASPDCTYHSKARGAKPIRSATKKRRALAWVVTRWAGQVKPDCIMLENVEEFAQWGPLVGRHNSLRPCPKRRGKTYRTWVQSLRNLGYRVEWRELRACDYGTPTIRKRLFVIARCDGAAIDWPEATHAPRDSEAVKLKRLLPYRAAAECIDWSLPMCSIFATREEAKAWAKFHGQATPQRPIAENSNRRIARGTMRFVVNSADPFFMAVTHQGSSDRTRSIYEPGATVTCAHRGETAVVAPSFQYFHSGPKGRERVGQVDGPLVTQDTRNRVALCAAFLAHNNNGHSPNSDAAEPSHTITADGAGHQVIGISLIDQHGTGEGVSPFDPARTVAAGGNHHGVLAAHVCRDFGESVGSDANEPIGTVTATGFGKARVVASFLQKYYGSGTGQKVTEPAHTIPTVDRLGLVSVEVEKRKKIPTAWGELTLLEKGRYVVTDIGMRMLQPRELYLCQGFRRTYIIDRGHDGRIFTKSKQVHMCGNSVCPPVASALVRANCANLIAREKPRSRRAA